MKRGIILTVACVLLLYTAVYASEKEEVKVRRVDMMLDKATVRPNQMMELYAEVEPSDADQELWWESMNPDIADVRSDGTVIGISPGAVEIRAVSPSGKYGSCMVTVPETAIRTQKPRIRTENLPGADFTNGEQLRAAALRVDVEAAVPKGTTLLTYTDKTTVTTAALRGASYSARRLDGSVRIRFSTGAQGSLTIDPALAPKEDFEILTGVGPVSSGEALEQATAQFGVAAAVRVEQGDFGMAVEVAVKAGLDAPNGKACTLYHQEDGRYIPLANQEYRVDGEGYLHFTTDRGGVIVIA